MAALALISPGLLLSSRLPSPRPPRFPRWLARLLNRLFGHR